MTASNRSSREDWAQLQTLLEIGAVFGWIDRWRSAHLYAQARAFIAQARYEQALQMAARLRRIDHFREATKKCPSMAQKRLVAHSMRHTTAVHLLQTGVELNVLRSWLGHSSIDSLQCYLDLDIRAKREVLETLVTPVFTNLLLHRAGPDAEEDIDLLDWLGKL